MDSCARLTEMRAAERLAARDASLFVEPDTASHRLGWVDAGARAVEEASGLVATAADLTSDGITDVVVLGMGGSSLAALVLARGLGPVPGSPLLHVMDTSSPSQTAELLNTLEPASTLVAVSSKSSSSAEPLALLEVFRPWLTAALGDSAGAHLIAITDPGSPLETLAREEAFAAVFLAPPDVGGRYSALTPFALLPAALAGIDVERLAGTAAALEGACRVLSDDNPAVALASWMADAYASGRDKLTVVCSPALSAFGLWVEQLVAESTGKGGAGVLPVLEEAPGLPEAHGADRMTFMLREEGDEELAGLPGLLPEGEPVFEVVIDDPYALAAEFVHWMWAVALFSALAGIEPFDQPDVEAAKIATRAILAGDGDVAQDGLAEVSAAPSAELGAAVRDLVGSVPAHGYLAMLAYLPEDESILAPLRSACADLSVARRVPVTLELGPRYLHSTGQFHKGGPKSGAFIVVSASGDSEADAARRYPSLAVLQRAQAAGDAAALTARGLPVLSVTIAAETRAALRPLLDALREVAGRD